MSSTKDFRADQVQTKKIVASGSTGTNAKLLVYSEESEDKTNPNTGAINSNAFGFGGIGEDIFLYVSGTVSSGSGTDRISVFGGSVVVSGNLSIMGHLSAASGGGGGGVGSASFGTFALFSGSNLVTSSLRELSGSVFDITLNPNSLNPAYEHTASIVAMTESIEVMVVSASGMLNRASVITNVSRYHLYEAEYDPTGGSSMLMLSGGVSYDVAFGNNANKTVAAAGQFPVLTVGAAGLSPTSDANMSITVNSAGTASMEVGGIAAGGPSDVTMAAISSVDNATYYLVTTTESPSLDAVAELNLISQATAGGNTKLSIRSGRAGSTITSSLNIDSVGELESSMSIRASSMLTSSFNISVEATGAIGYPHTASFRVATHASQSDGLSRIALEANAPYGDFAGIALSSTATKAAAVLTNATASTTAVNGGIAQSSGEAVGISYTIGGGGAHSVNVAQATAGSASYEVSIVGVTTASYNLQAAASAGSSNLSLMSVAPGTSPLGSMSDIKFHAVSAFDTASTKIITETDNINTASLEIITYATAGYAKYYNVVNSDDVSDAITIAYANNSASIQNMVLSTGESSMLEQVIGVETGSFTTFVSSPSSSIRLHTWASNSPVALTGSPGLTSEIDLQSRSSVSSALILKAETQDEYGFSHVDMGSYAKSSSNVNISSEANQGKSSVTIDSKTNLYNPEGNDSNLHVRSTALSGASYLNVESVTDLANTAYGNINVYASGAGFADFNISSVASNGGNSYLDLESDSLEGFGILTAVADGKNADASFGSYSSHVSGGNSFTTISSTTATAGTASLNVYTNAQSGPTSMLLQAYSLQSASLALESISDDVNISSSMTMLTDHLEVISASRVGYNITPSITGAYGRDTFFHVSGSIAGKDLDYGKVGVFGGDLVVSGNLHLLGTAYGIPTGSGGVTGPTTSELNRLVLWGDGTGDSLLTSSLIESTGTVINQIWHNYGGTTQTNILTVSGSLSGLPGEMLVVSGNQVAVAGQVASTLFAGSLAAGKASGTIVSGSTARIISYALADTPAIAISSISPAGGPEAEIDITSNGNPSSSILIESYNQYGVGTGNSKVDIYADRTNTSAINIKSGDTSYVQYANLWLASEGDISSSVSIESTSSLGDARIQLKTLTDVSESLINVEAFSSNSNSTVNLFSIAHGAANSTSSFEAGAFGYSQSPSNAEFRSWTQYDTARVLVEAFHSNSVVPNHAYVSLSAGQSGGSIIEMHAFALSASGFSKVGFNESNMGADTFFHVSGSIAGKDLNTGKVSVFGGDLVVSGNLHLLGTAYGLPTGSGGVTGPTTSEVNRLVLWGDGTGDSLVTSSLIETTGGFISTLFGVPSIDYITASVIQITSSNNRTVVFSGSQIGIEGHETVSMWSGKYPLDPEYDPVKGFAIVNVTGSSIDGPSVQVVAIGSTPGIASPEIVLTVNAGLATGVTGVMGLYSYANEGESSIYLQSDQSYGTPGVGQSIVDISAIQGNSSSVDIRAGEPNTPSNSNISNLNFNAAGVQSNIDIFSNGTSVSDVKLISYSPNNAILELSSQADAASSNLSIFNYSTSSNATVSIINKNGSGTGSPANAPELEIASIAENASSGAMVPAYAKFGSFGIWGSETNIKSVSTAASSSLNLLSYATASNSYVDIESVTPTFGSAYTTIRSYADGVGANGNLEVIAEGRNIANATFKSMAVTSSANTYVRADSTLNTANTYIYAQSKQSANLSLLAYSTNDQAASNITSQGSSAGISFSSVATGSNQNSSIWLSSSATTGTSSINIRAQYLSGSGFTKIGFNAHDLIGGTGADTFFHVSGSIAGKNSNTGKISTFGGDVMVSGNLHTPYGNFPFTQVFIATATMSLGYTNVYNAASASFDLAFPTSPLNNQELRIKEIGGNASGINFNPNGSSVEGDGFVTTSLITISESYATKTWKYNSELARWLRLN